MIKNPLIWTKYPKTNPSLHWKHKIEATSCSFLNFHRLAETQHIGGLQYIKLKPSTGANVLALDISQSIIQMN